MRQNTNVCFRKITKSSMFQRNQEQALPISCQKKAWMNSNLFEYRVYKLDRKFQRQNRKMALIVDNYAQRIRILMI